MTKQEKKKFKKLEKVWRERAKNLIKLSKLHHTKGNKPSALRWGRVADTFEICADELKDGIEYFPSKSKGQ